ncbi:helix-turn-helix domain-containing protein [Kocuria sp. NPDC057446]|uniref:AraC-like ligand-binding domain-containing protein n=1 Tax=Kocuria sp. NPDC057446 TaxID=3346137 RepID=UPI0036AB97BB
MSAGVAERDGRPRQHPLLATSATDFARLASAVFVPLEVNTTERVSFRARIDHRPAEHVGVSHIRATRHVVEHDVPPGASGGAVKFGLQLGGTCTVEQDGRTAALRPGDMVLYDTDRPYRLEFPQEARLLVLMLPGSGLELPRRAVGTATATRLPGDEGVGALAADFLGGLADRMHVLTGRSAGHLGRSAVDLVGALLAERADEQAGDRVGEHAAGGTEALRTAARTFVEDRLADPELGPPMVAAHLFLSVRRLHEVFQDEEHTLSAWIRHRRLQQCRRALLDPAHAHRPVSRIGAAWGFPDAAHFSRVFKQEFGLSPAQFRAAARG